MSAPARPLLRPGTIVIYVLLAFFGALTLLPFVGMICAAVKTNEDYFTSHFLPHGHGLFGVAWDRLTLSQFARLPMNSPP